MSVFSIEDETLDNTAYLRVAHTDDCLQIVLMHLRPGEDTGVDTHDATSKAVHVVDGEGTATLDGIEYDLGVGDLVVVPAGTEHTLSASKDEHLKVYVVCSGEPLHTPDEVRARVLRK
jgi:mannose-6-phosphate isomerase-like protein (cupin superfamily)